MNYKERVSTGITGFDKTIDMLRMGDNVVWQVGDIESYKKVVYPYVEQAKKDRRRIVYFRFGSHEKLLSEEDGIAVYYLDASLGFERFAITVHQVAEAEGTKVFYVFDCLTELLHFWYSDLMIGNFFQVTCPYLYQMDTVAYFAIERNCHNFETIGRIRETTQCLLDLYDLDGTMYIHPLKADGRYSPTMFFPHKIEGNQSFSITSSSKAAELFSGLEWRKKHTDYWNTIMEQAKETVGKEKEEQEKMKALLLKLLIGAQTRLLKLCEKQFTLRDLVHVASREVGTGYIGGKSVGMILARQIIKNASGEYEELKNYLEPDDSFFIGTDVFYTYIVQNGGWGLWQQQKTETGYLTLSSLLKQKLMEGAFSDSIEEEFMHILEYFGQSPIIIRSSSLLEDNFGNAFAGKYESVFCVNQGTPQERLKAFEDAVRTVYASTMNQDALHYRKQRGLSLKDEQMAILVQRVSGDYYDDYFFPHVAGVGNSSNLYVWEKGMDMSQGMLRIVLGLGTRAVDRVIGDYVKIVALDDPLRLPGLIAQDEQKYSQKKIDMLDLRSNIWCSKDVTELEKMDLGVDKSMFFSKNMEEARRLWNLGYKDRPIPITLNFKKMLSKTDFPDVMRRVLKLISSEYDYPVDIEFTVNFQPDDTYQFNLVQCRPLQTRGLGKSSEPPKEVEKEKCLLYSEGNFMGGNIRIMLDYVIFIDVQAYLGRSEQDKYQTARYIGKLNQILKEKQVLLMGPGRWGTTTSSLGVPVHFTEISHMTAICEISCQKEGLMPELSYGSHFFQDLVESGVFYIALFRDQEKVWFKGSFLEKENKLSELLKEAEGFSDVIKVIEANQMELYSDIQRQMVFCRELEPEIDA